MSENEKDNDGGAVNAKNFKHAERGASSAVEKEEGEAAKKKVRKENKPAKKGQYVVTRAVRCDGKNYERGDDYEGLLYPDLVGGDYPSLCDKKEYEKRP